MKNKNSDIDFDTNLSKLLVSISTKDNVDDNLNTILRFALEYYDADRAYIFDVDKILNMGCNTYEVCADGVTSEIDNLQSVPYELAPTMIDNFYKGNTFFLNNIEDLKEEKCSEYNLLNQQGIISLMITPYDKKGVSGCMGVDNPKKHCQDDLMLKTLAYIVLLCSIEEQMGKSIVSSIKDIHIRTKDDIYIKTFGDFEIDTYTKNFSVNNVSSKQCILFFIYLLLNKNETIPVEKLAKVFWPDQEIFDPYSYIKNMTFRTRRALKNISDIELIVANNSSYTINNNLNIVTDYDIVNSLYKETLKINVPTTIKMENYEKILELYKNTMFNNISTEIWMLSFVNKYRAIYTEVVDKYLKILYSQKRYKKILEITEKALKINYNISMFHYYTILAYLGDNKKNVAISYYNQCKDILIEEEIDKLNKIIDFNN